MFAFLLIGVQRVVPSHRGIARAHRSHYHPPAATERGGTVQILKDATLPADAARATLAGRVWRPDVEGPAVVAVRADGVFDVTPAAPTMRDLCEAQNPAAALRAAAGERIGSLDDILANTPPDTRDPRKPWLLAPIDLQAIKAAGVTFVVVAARAADRGAGARPAGAATAIRAEMPRRSAPTCRR